MNLTAYDSKYIRVIMEVMHMIKVDISFHISFFFYMLFFDEFVFLIFKWMLNTLVSNWGRHFRISEMG